MTSRATRIEKPELLGRLAGGHAARVTVVTPNQRLAAALARTFDDRRSAEGLASWESADILPLPAFVERLYEDALYSELAPRLPILLSGVQEQTLWEDIVRGSEAGAALLSVPSAAALAREAWEIVHAWRLMTRLKGTPANDDARTFADWAWRYEGITRRDRHVERARLADVVAQHLAHAALRKPATLVVYGFDILNAQQREFFAALAKAGVAVLACGPQGCDQRRAARRVAFACVKDEIRAAAKWARARLEADSSARIGIVVPDLARSRNAVRRIFAQVLEPARPLPARAQRSPPFNLSLGEPLASYPLVVAAFRVLELVCHEVGFERASGLIRSPFIAGADAEIARRAGLDAQLRNVAGPKIGLERLRRAIAGLSVPDKRVPSCPILAQRLAEISKISKEDLQGAKHPGEWGKAISALLDAAGFPGERTLDSVEYQTLAKLHEALAGFAALDRVVGRMRFDDACARFARITGNALFQPEAPEVPIQVLGVLESAGLEFDHLWVMGLTDEAWPIAARPNPFIPVALQRAAGVPEASAAASLELDSRITRGWLAAAREVVFSHPLGEEDRELVPSPLIRDLAESRVEDLALPEYDGLHEAIRRARREERAADFRAPPVLPRTAHAGGTAIFKDQAACPFRAFAVHRLGAEGLDAPPAGLDARERGTLLHAMLAHVWRELKSRSGLDAASGADLDALLALAADHAIDRLRRRRPDAIDGRFAALEKTRLVKLGRAWLEIERRRPPFEVAAIEQKHAVSFGGVTVNARLDRMDSLIADEQGQWLGRRRAILDYKTGSANVGDWLGERPDDPQLPLYAVSLTDAVAGHAWDPSREGDAGVCAVAFARLKAGDMGFRGIARDEGLIPGVATLGRQRSIAAKDYGSWEELLAGWRRELEAIGTAFAVGEARVDPKRGGETCSTCDLKPLCRINERAFSIGSPDEEAGIGGGA